MNAPLIGIIMGSASDFDVMKSACDVLDEFGVAYEKLVVSAHRAPDYMFEYAAGAEARGLQVIIAAAGGAAHLPGMVASKTLVPVLGVPIAATVLEGTDALMSIAQMPAGVPVGTLAIGKPGAVNAALFALQLLATTRPALRAQLQARRDARAAESRGSVLP